MQKFSRNINGFWKLLEVIPLAISAFVAIFGVLSAGALVVGNFTNGVLIGCAVVATLLSYQVVRSLTKALSSSALGNSTKAFNLIVLTAVCLWVGVNGYYASESVLMNRDPALYTVGAKQLSQSHSADKVVADLGLDYQLASIESNGTWRDFRNTNDSTLQVQGMNLLKTLLAVSARVVGEAAIYKLNVVFGGLAILLLYSLSKVFMSPGWAATASGVFAATLPLIYFSKDTYTEPLTAVLALSCILAVAIAFRSPDSKALWALAGLFAGAGTIVRPDAYITIAALVLVLIAYCIYQWDDIKNILLNRVSPLFFSCLAASVVGWLDLTTLNRMYYYGHGQEVRLQILLIIVLLIGGSLLFIINTKDQNITKLINYRPSRKVGLILATIIPVLGLILVARPLWWTSITDNPGPGTGLINIIQDRTGDLVAPRRYWEMSMQWVSWYMGEVLLVLGFIGVGIGVHKIYTKKDFPLLFAATILVMTAALYLNTPRITPDQIWAMRRFLPVIIPGLILFGVYALSIISNRLISKKDEPILKNTFYFLASSYLVITPLLISKPFLRINEKPNHAAAVHSLCGSLPDNALVVSLGSVLELDMVHTSRVYCGVESVGYNYHKDSKNPNDLVVLDSAKLEQISKAADRLGLSPYLVFHGSQRSGVKIPEPKAGNVYEYQINRVEQTVSGPPRDVFSEMDSIEVLKIGKRGEITPI